MTLVISGSNTSQLNTIEAEVKETETHLHSYGRFFEKATTPSGETHVADRIGSGAGAFQPNAGVDDWGSWLQILGSSDTPADAGMLYFDLHRLSITAAQRNEVYFMQIAYGESGAAALAANTYDDEVFAPASNLVDSAPIPVQNRRVAVGTKAWIRLKCPGQSGATLDLYVSLHEYPE